AALTRRALQRRPSRAVERLGKGIGVDATPRGADRVVALLEPDLVLERAARRFLAQPLDRCVKCNSTFVGREPAFIHCFYCGKMARIANASLLAQEEFEMRSGLRIAV